MLEEHEGVANSKVRGNDCDGYCILYRTGTSFLTVSHCKWMTRQFRPIEFEYWDMTVAVARKRECSPYAVLTKGVRIARRIYNTNTALIHFPLPITSLPL